MSPTEGIRCRGGGKGGPLTSTPAWLGENLSGNLGPGPGRNPGGGLTRGGQGWDNVSHLECSLSLGAPTPSPSSSSSRLASIFPSAPSCSLGPRARTPPPPFIPESHLLTSTQACQAGVQCEQIWCQELAFITPSHLHSSPRSPGHCLARSSCSSLFVEQTYGPSVAATILSTPFCFVFF